MVKLQLKSEDQAPLHCVSQGGESDYLRKTVYSNELWDSRMSEIITELDIDVTKYVEWDTFFYSK